LLGLDETLLPEAVEKKELCPTVNGRLMDRAPVFGSPLVLGCLGRSFLAQVRPQKKNWPESEGLVQTADPAGCCAISSVWEERPHLSCPNPSNHLPWEN